MPGLRSSSARGAVERSRRRDHECVRAPISGLVASKRTRHRSPRDARRRLFERRPGGSRFLSIATGGTGGVYYPYGGGLAKVLNENLPGVRATAEVTAASVDNLKLIRDGRADVAFTLADTLADAVAGRGAFEGRPVPAASLAVLYSNYTQLVTRPASGIAIVADLRGKTSRPGRRAAAPRSSRSACCGPPGSIPIAT